MVQINFALKEVNCKIVYYGLGLSGKTTNLELIHKKVPTENKGELTSIATEGNSALFFDFLPLGLGEVGGMKTKFQLYALPGQSYYNSTRKLVLQGVDGVIFVADSQYRDIDFNNSSRKERWHILELMIENILTRPYAKKSRIIPSEIEISVIYHQGKKDHIYLSLIDEYAIIATVFSDDTTIGRTRLYTQELIKKISRIFKAAGSKTPKVPAILSNLKESCKDRMDDIFKNEKIIAI